MHSSTNLIFGVPLMTSSSLRWAAGLAAIFVATCFSVEPAAAATCSGKQCAAANAKNKVAKQPRRVNRHARVQRSSPQVVAQNTRAQIGKWHGWGASFYLSGVRYEGGNPIGPAAWYNNWEGGFHPVVYWRIRDNQLN
jgi:hypothetical protein